MAPNAARSHIWVTFEASILHHNFSAGDKCVKTLISLSEDKRGALIRFAPPVVSRLQIFRKISNVLPTLCSIFVTKSDRVA